MSLKIILFVTESIPGIVFFLLPSFRLHRRLIFNNFNVILISTLLIFERGLTESLRVHFLELFSLAHSLCELPRG